MTLIWLVIAFGLIHVSEGILFGRLFRDSKKTASSPEKTRAMYAELGIYL